MDYCIVCCKELGRKQVISCDQCSCKVHRLCNTGISQTDYHRMKRGEITLQFVCTGCQNQATRNCAGTTAGQTEDPASSSYGLRHAEQRRKPARLVEVSPPPRAKAKRSRKTRQETTKRRSQTPSKRKTRKPSTPEKEDPLPDWYFYSPPPAVHLYTEEKDGCSISYFDDPEPAPGMPFNPIYRYKYPQLKKTKRIWVKKTNRSLFETTQPPSTDPVFKVPTQSVSKSDLKYKRKVEETQTIYEKERPLAKRQRTESSTTIGTSYAITNSSLKSVVTTQVPDDVGKKGLTDGVESTPERVSSERNSTDEQQVRRQRVDFQLNNSDLDLSVVSSGSANQSFLDHSFRSFQSVSDIFNLSSENVMNMTRDSIGVDASFNSSYSRILDNSFSHLADLI